ncbi:MAG: glycoside hydrolase family 3 C-terminal domain-containing protein [Acidobacteriota bacterium]|nr:MAG: glycoside hydrolase family 3 C-terminal domain-containing protein [Acidobacteriota bacterium]
MPKKMWFAVGVLVLLASFSGTQAQGTYESQPVLGERNIQLLHDEGFQFRDLNKNGKVDVYEDWRQPVSDRVDDLASQMTLEEKAGMLMINTLNAETQGTLSDRAVQYVQDEKMTRFIFRNTVTATPVVDAAGGWRGAQLTPYEAAQFMNAMQELMASTRLGIPALFKSNARNHYDHDARAGINVPAGSFSEWPKEAGLAATRDLDLIAEFAQIIAQEWTSVGLRSMYGYMADLATEPRWFRNHETFTEDADLAAQIMTVLVKNLQGDQLNTRSVALTIKHFPGGGPQEGGGDPHYGYGKNQVYPANNFEYHVKPFKAAIEAGVSSIMPYYGIPVDQKYLPNDVGMSFSKGIVTELLRDELGFKGNVNSDTGIIQRMPWGVEDKSLEDRIAMAIEAGVDVLSGFSDNKQILGLITSGRISEERVSLSVKRLLAEQFELGLFENPYVDPNRASYVVGNRAFQRKAEIAQRKSIVLLQRKEDLLPLPMPKPKSRARGPFADLEPQAPSPVAPSERETVQLYTMGMNPEVVADQRWFGFTVISGDYDPSQGETRPVVPPGTDYAILRVEVTNSRGQGFGGPDPEELDLLAFSDMAKSESWKLTPSLADIQGVMTEVGAEKTILAIQFRQPYVLDEASGVLNAGAILATFGVSDAALMDILTGFSKPSGKLPYALARTAQAIKDQDSDDPGYRERDTLFPFGHGLTY